MDWENFDAKKYRLLVQIGMPFLALLLILLFVVLPVVFLQAALEREARNKGSEIHRVFDVDLF